MLRSKRTSVTVSADTNALATVVVWLAAGGHETRATWEEPPLVVVIAAVWLTNLYRCSPQPTQGICRRAHREQAGLAWSHFV